MALHHQLHHRPEIDDIRYAYDSDDRSYLSDYDFAVSYPRSQTDSDKSNRTRPTLYSNSSASRKLPRIHNNTYNSQHDQHASKHDSSSRYFQDRQPQASPQASVATYASTVQSEDDNVTEEPQQYMVPENRARSYEPSAIAATPSDFSELFPSHRRLAVRHDDSTLDGNMNLRVDTEVTMHSGQRCDMTLFHLRMHDLRDREFSLRRYCRDSGREVCHSARRQQKPVSQKRPGFQRSLSNALNSMRSKSDQNSPTLASLKRNDSGYGSAHSSLDFDRDHRPHSAHESTKPPQPVDLNVVKLEFSNYAQVDVKRTGVKGSKRYEFEYWGIQYAWRRVVRRNTPNKSVSYHLTKSGNDRVLAYIIPSPLTPAQAQEEHKKGGWVPPCSMWIADDDIVRGQKDVAE